MNEPILHLKAGNFAGIGLGDDLGRVRGTFGPPADHAGGLVTPAGEDAALAGLPGVVTPPGLGETYQDMLDGILRYRGVVFHTTPHAGVFYIAVTNPATMTSEGPAIGDPLSRVQERVPGLRRGIRNQGTEYPRIEYCAGVVGQGVHVWIGGDPIRSMSVASTRLD